MSGYAWAAIGMTTAGAAAYALTSNRLRNTLGVRRFRHALARNPHLGEIARLEQKIADTERNIRDCLEGGDS